MIPVTNWDASFKGLKAFKDRFHHCRVPRVWRESPKLPQWCQQIRNNLALLSPDQLRKLTLLGFVFGFKNNRWLARFLELARFQAPLGHWVFAVRAKKEKLYPEKRDRLNRLGFDWDPLGNALKKRMEEFRAFKEHYGHCRVPVHWTKNKTLGGWVSDQRALRGRGALSRERIQFLDSLGFDWNVGDWDRKWRQSLKNLRAFKKRFGHCHITPQWPEYKTLAIWAKTQRRRRKQLHLSRERIRLLDKLGFDWTPPKIAVQKR